MGVCEFDGKLSLARLRSRFVIYTRANLKVNGGGRYAHRRPHEILTRYEHMSLFEMSDESLYMYSAGVGPIQP